MARGTLDALEGGQAVVGVFGQRPAIKYQMPRKVRSPKLCNSLLCKEGTGDFILLWNESSARSKQNYIPCVDLLLFSVHDAQRWHILVNLLAPR